MLALLSSPITKWFLATIISIAISARFGHTLGLLLDKLIKIPLKFLHLNTVYQFFQRNMQIVVFAIVFFLTLSTSFFLNEYIRKNDISYIAENLSYTEYRILHDLHFNLHNNDSQKTPLKTEWERIQNSEKLNKGLKEILEELVQKSTIALNKKKLITPGLNKNSLSPNFQITTRGEEVTKYILSDKMQKMLWQTAQDLSYK